ncbi:MAG: hypothetical protein H6707_08690 [Deltaproteobacteria bacterium]|nr:hypothetical protein [Deltaproteobacteria bacterium]
MLTRLFTIVALIFAAPLPLRAEATLAGTVRTLLMQQGARPFCNPKYQRLNVRRHSAAGYQGNPIAARLLAQQPVLMTGSTAIVSVLEDPTGKQPPIAAKFFAIHDPARDVRYEKIAKYLDKHPELPELMRYDYQAQGCQVRPGTFLPVMFSEFSTSRPLQDVVRELALSGKEADQDRLNALADQVLDLEQRMRAARLGYGDIQGDNLRVSDDNKLVIIPDYQPLEVPGLYRSGVKEIDERGTRGYQHPARLDHGKKRAQSGVNVGNFSNLVVYLSLRALAEDPTLYQKANPKGQELLFSHNGDFLLRGRGKSVKRSALLEAMANSTSAEVRYLSDALFESLKKSSDRTAPLATLVAAALGQSKAEQAKPKANAAKVERSTPPVAEQPTVIVQSDVPGLLSWLPDVSYAPSQQTAGGEKKKLQLNSVAWRTSVRGSGGLPAAGTQALAKLYGQVDQRARQIVAELPQSIADEMPSDKTATPIIVSGHIDSNGRFHVSATARHDAHSPTLVRQIEQALDGKQLADQGLAKSQPISIEIDQFLGKSPQRIVGSRARGIVFLVDQIVTQQGDRLSRFFSHHLERRVQESLREISVGLSQRQASDALKRLPHQPIKLQLRLAADGRLSLIPVGDWGAQPWQQEISAAIAKIKLYNPQSKQSLLTVALEPSALRQGDSAARASRRIAPPPKYGRPSVDYSFGEMSWKITSLRASGGLTTDRVRSALQKYLKTAVAYLTEETYAGMTINLTDGRVGKIGFYGVIDEQGHLEISEVVPEKGAPADLMRLMISREVEKFKFADSANRAGSRVFVEFELNHRLYDPGLNELMGSKLPKAHTKVPRDKSLRWDFGDLFPATTEVEAGFLQAKKPRSLAVIGRRLGAYVDAAVNGFALPQKPLRGYFEFEAQVGKDGKLSLLSWSGQGDYADRQLVDKLRATVETFVLFEGKEELKLHAGETFSTAIELKPAR